MPISFFREIDPDRPFEDRLQTGEFEGSVDVIVPILHSTPFWKQNLKSYFREIPINRLLIGDAGAIDGSVDLALTFPRVEVLNHKNVKTLARSLALLVSEIETEYFIYLQSDTFLPAGWFDSMWAKRNDFEWFGCPERTVIALSGPLNDYSGKRPLAGTQFGKTSAFENIEKSIQDDFGYRQEDFILDQLVKDNGYRSGANTEVFHFHQISDRVTSGRKLELESFTLSFVSDEDDARVVSTQIWGLIKYCKPSNEMALRFTKAEITHVLRNRLASPLDLQTFASTHNEEWLPIISTLARRERLETVFGLRLIKETVKWSLLKAKII